MLSRSRHVNIIASALFVAFMGACSGITGCGACSATGPLPGGALPADQTVEGGAQIRVTPTGFTKLTSIVPSVLNDALGNGFCLPQGQIGSLGTLGTGAKYCDGNEGASCNPGCQVNVGINNNGITLTPNEGAGTMNVRISTHISTTVNIDGKVVGIPFSCTLGITSNDLNGDMDIAFGINATTGELDIHLAQINAFHLNVDFSGCSFVSSIANFVGDFIDSFVGQFIIGLLTPVIDNLVQGFLPHPLGIEGVLDVGQLLQGVSPGTKASMEARLVPGGYVSLHGNGLSLGVITGLNSDEDPATRTPDLDSEPALCVPPLAAPDFSMAPWALPRSTRQTFTLAAADEFVGSPDPAADLAMGISETTLDLAGHHAVTSGMMCLGVGTTYIKQLNVGTIGLLVPSLSELTSDTGTDPLLMVTRPQEALDFTIGDNTTTSPALTIGINHMEVDFYAFLYERYVRAFTLDLTMNVGVNLDFTQNPGEAATVKPTLVGIDSHSVTIKVLNSEFVRETPDQLEAVLPSVFDLVTPLLGNLPDITVPSFAGFSLNNLSIQHVTTSQDDFLALYASLGSSTMMRQRAQTDRFMADAVTAMDRDQSVAQAKSHGIAKLASVVTPAPEKVRASLMKVEGGALPQVTFDVDARDQAGRELEWSWNLNGGLFRQWTTASPLVISDKAFAWQGKYTIGLRSRVKGDYRTVSATTETPVIIDSLGPKILSDKATWVGDEWQVPMWDMVSGRTIQYGFGKPGDAVPNSWIDGGTAKLARDDVDSYTVDGKVAVFGRDEAGNVSVIFLAPFHGQGDGAGCACNTTGGPGAGGLALFGLVGALVFGRGRRAKKLLARRSVRQALKSAAAFAVIAIGTSLTPGCSCENKPGEAACDIASDCPADFCAEGQIAFCIDNTCVCSDDIPLGHVGPYSDVAVGPDLNIWVSAYAQSHGDLVVAHATGGRIPDDAWEWVDGVPEGPVVVEGSHIRGGIADDGPDVGMYTSIAVGPDNLPMVSYFDVDSASLKFAQKQADGTWAIHIVDQGTGALGETGVLTGMYSSLTVRSDDGRPGIAYLAHVADATGGHAEVRYVSAQTPHPTVAGDWQSWVVDTAPLPVVDPNNADVYPLPGGLGLFIDSARLANQAPVVTYYDRANGDLKVAKFSPESGQFAAPVVLDGSNGTDEGWSPSVAVDTSGNINVAYVGATEDDLKFITDASGATPAIIDDGYRIVGQTVDGLPKPEFHFVGDDASIVIPPGGRPLVAYQDATTQELLLAHQELDGTWTHESIAGATDPWPGAYGFFAAAALSPTEVVMSSWVIDQPTSENWVEVFTHAVVIQ